MNQPTPVMLFDGDCGFCRRWIEKWRRATEPLVAYEPYQKMLSYYPQVSEAQCQKSVQLIMLDGQVFSGAKAVLKALRIADKAKFFYWCYENLPLFAPLAEFFYQIVARNRMFFSKFL